MGQLHGALAACSADRAVAPAPPSLAGAVGSHQEPQLVGDPIPASDTSSRCMKFEVLPIGTRWGAAVPGTAKGVVVHAENGISMKMADYLTPSGSGTTPSTATR